MNRLRELLRRLRWMSQREAQEADLEEELLFHLERSIHERTSEGAWPAEAARSALVRMGNVTGIKEASREAWAYNSVESVLRDFGYCVRQLHRNRVFAVAAVLSLALGVGAVLTVFALIDAVIFRRLPVHEPERLVMFEDPSFSAPIFMEVNRRAQSFDGFFGWSNERLAVSWGERAEGVEGLLTLGPYHETLGVHALIGRTLTRDDDFGRGGRPAVISHACWQARYGGDNDVLGRTIYVSGAAYTIVGVTPASFSGLAPGTNPEVTIPATTLPMRHPGASDRLSNPSESWLHLTARLKSGISLAQANGELQVYWPQAKEATITSDLPPEFRRRYLDRKTSLVSGATGFSSVRNRFRDSLWLLFGLVGLLLTVACASVTNLMLARMTRRRRELAVRIAIGAGRARILRQVMMESLLLASLGGLGGVAVCSLAGSAVVGLLSTSGAPIYLDLALDGRVLGFGLLTTSFAAMVCTLVPAVVSTRTDAFAALQDTRTLGRRQDLSTTLVVVQVALSTLLLAGCALFLRSLENVMSRDGGFERGALVMAALDPVSAGYKGPRMASWYEQVVERVGSLPSIESASLSWAPPISSDMGSWWSRYTAIDGQEPAQEGERTYINQVSAEYFSTVGTKVLKGRSFAPLDAEAGAGVAIINEALARDSFGSQSPVGRRISLGREPYQRDLEIVGVVENSSYQFLQEPARRIAYLPLARGSEMFEGSNLTLEARSRSDASAAIGDVAAAIRALDPAMPLRIETMKERIAESLVREIALAKLASVLGFLSLALALAGLYGLLAYNVARRTNELGVRMALGATRGRVLEMVLRHGARVAALGLITGVLAFLALGRLASGLIHGVAAADAMSIAISGLLVCVTALGAALAPALQASRLSPTDAIRQD